MLLEELESEEPGPWEREAQMVHDRADVGALICLCQRCRTPLEVYEQLVMFDDGLAWPTIVEVCPRCDGEALRRSLRVALRPR